MRLARLPGAGWLALIGGGEFSFGETVEADRAWLEKTSEGAVGFLPAASGSTEYGVHFANYLRESFERSAETVPIYRARDARRAKNSQRLASPAAIYLGGGVSDRLLEALRDTPALETLHSRFTEGACVVAIAAAAQGLGGVCRSLYDGQPMAGLGWLPDGVVETNFDPSHDRRLRRLLEHPGARWGLGIPASAAVLLGPQGELEVIGTAFAIEGADGDLQVIDSNEMR